MKKEGVGVENHSIFNNIDNTDNIDGGNGNDDTKAQSVTCWSCLTPIIVAEMFCHVCNCLQRPGDNYFSLLDLPLHFRLDLEKLEDNYLAMQAKVHPDNFAKSQSEREVATIYSSVLNQAYQALKDTYLRALYVLVLNGVQTPEQKGDVTINDQELLRQMMEVNQHIMTLESKGKCQQMIVQTEEEMSIVEDDLCKLYEEKNWQEFRKKAHHLRYLQKNITRIKTKEGVLEA